MRKIILIVAPITLAYLILAWFSGNLLGAQGRNLWILRVALSLIGLVAAAVVVWYFATIKKEEAQAAAAADEAPAGGEDIPVLIAQAQKKLSGSRLEKGARIGNLPAILLLGESSSTKTTIVLHSGLEPELLAGQVYRDNNVVPTRSANLWYSRGTLFVEAGGKLLDDSAGRTDLVKRLQPRQMGAVVGRGGQASRAALVCVEIERITGGAQAMAATARNLRARLSDISQSFGIQLPVYVLFTKTDRLPFFVDFVRNLTNEEATQVLGVTLPTPGQSSGIYAEEQTVRLSGFFDQLFRALCDARREILSRENDPTKLPGSYEFPREFRKLRGPLTEFLVDLCRPSQLTVGPYLRGFYFSGLRPVIIKESAPARETQAPEKQGFQSATEATQMFRVPAGGQVAAAAPQAARAAVARKVPQWLFLGHFFSDVLLADRAAMGASGASAKTDLLRRILLISAAVLCLILCIGFTVSYSLNSGLVATVKKASLATSTAPVGTDLATRDSLQNLDTLRRSLLNLRDGNPPWDRWGLFVGKKLYPDVYRIYFSRFQQLLLSQTQANLAAYLNHLPPAQGPGTPAYDEAYNKLKAYLITTSNHEKSTHEFLAPVLRDAWNTGQTADEARKQLALSQFQFYSDELPHGDDVKPASPFSKENDPKAVGHARQYLKTFEEFERIYQNMMAAPEVPKSSINFHHEYPDAKDYVLDPYEVTGPFTKAGWDVMIKAIRSPDSYVKGDDWVLGIQNAAAVNDHGALIGKLLARYQGDFIKEWRNYLSHASVVKYKDIKDAADKLDKFSSNQCPLLQLFALASQHTTVDDDQVKKAFQSVRFVAPAGGPQNQEYITALATLQQVVAKAVNLPEDAGDRQVSDAAAAAKQVTKLLASQKFDPDPEGHVDALVHKLLDEPIINAEPQSDVDALNAKGQQLCGQFRAVLNKYPFNPNGKQDATVEDLNGLLRPKDGEFWTFYQAKLQKYLPKPDYALAPGAPLTPAFVAFFKQAAAFSDALYAGGSQDPHFTYTLKPVPTEGVKKAGLEIDGQTLDWPGGAPVAKQFTWPGSGHHGAKGTWGADGASFSDNEGLWAVFRLFGDVDKRAPAQGGGESLDWVIRTGAARKPSILPSGNPLTVRFELDMGASPHVFEKGYFSRLNCVAAVAK
jgi:type VI secretion system protein ImpL